VLQPVITDHNIKPMLFEKIGHRTMTIGVNDNRTAKLSSQQLWLITALCGWC
jgi:hypothetical protein